MLRSGGERKRGKGSVDRHEGVRLVSPRLFRDATSNLTSSPRSFPHTSHTFFLFAQPPRIAHRMIHKRRDSTSSLRHHLCCIIATSAACIQSSTACSSRSYPSPSFNHPQQHSPRSRNFHRSCVSEFGLSLPTSRKRFQSATAT